MKVIKRDNSIEEFDSEKIINALRGSFKSVNSNLDINIIEKTLKEVVDSTEDKKEITVEEIQDTVEKSLMVLNRYKELKSYILYREKRSNHRKNRKNICENIKSYDLEETIKKIQKQFDEEKYNLEHLYYQFNNHLKENMTDSEKIDLMIRISLEMTSVETPEWEKISGRILSKKINLDVDDYSKEKNICSFYEKIVYLTKEKLYGEYILENYKESDIKELENYLNYKNDDIFNYSGLNIVVKRYLIQDKDNNLLEKPQEMFMGIAMHLSMNEEKKIYWCKRIYDTISTLKVTLATPTLSNSRKPFHQLSSCFIDTVPDNLEGIYRSIDNFAQVSKYGGGMGLYFGKVRALGSEIRNVKNVSGGVNRWIKLANDTAIAVDQLGMRKGAVAVYLDIWHKDILDFLQIKTNNGDDRLKAHDVFSGISYPNLFWKKVKEDLDNSWYLFCPYEVKSIVGYNLEDFYGKEWEEKYQECIDNKDLPRKEIKIKELIRLILKSVIETGTPFAFYRDTVNEMNPNNHKGMIYCSNLCVEIAQNMSAIETLSKTIEIEGEEIVVEKTKPGDFVVCNLGSLALGNIDVNNSEELEKIVETSVRMLDSVIDLNFYPTPYAEITNKRYRSIGLGVSGYHHMLVKNNIDFESFEHMAFSDKLFEKINYYAIKTSNKLAMEKGSYKYFEGSDFHTGKYFEKRQYTDDKWKELRDNINKNGVRNGYIMAIAPTSSTSIIATTTAGVDPIMKKYFLEEKKGMIVPRVAPSMNGENEKYYKEAHNINQKKIIEAAGIRQRHIDQSQSLNLYITTDYTMRQILDLYIQAYEEGVKTIYYIRSKSLEVEECKSCSL